MNGPACRMISAEWPECPLSLATLSLATFSTDRSTENSVRLTRDLKGHRQFRSPPSGSTERYYAGVNYAVLVQLISCPRNSRRSNSASRAFRAAISAACAATSATSATSSSRDGSSARLRIIRFLNRKTTPASRKFWPAKSKCCYPTWAVTKNCITSETFKVPSDQVAVAS